MNGEQALATRGSARRPARATSPARPQQEVIAALRDRIVKGGFLDNRPGSSSRWARRQHQHSPQPHRRLREVAAGVGRQDGVPHRHPAPAGQERVRRARLDPDPPAGRIPGDGGPPVHAGRTCGRRGSRPCLGGQRDDVEALVVDELRDQADTQADRQAQAHRQADGHTQAHREATPTPSPSPRTSPRRAHALVRGRARLRRRGSAAGARASRAAYVSPCTPRAPARVPGGGPRSAPGKSTPIRQRAANLLRVRHRPRLVDPGRRHQAQGRQPPADVLAVGVEPPPWRTGLNTRRTAGRPCRWRRTNCQPPLFDARVAVREVAHELGLAESVVEEQVLGEERRRDHARPGVGRSRSPAVGASRRPPPGTRSGRRARPSRPPGRRGTAVPRSPRGRAPGPPAGGATGRGHRTRATRSRR